MSHEIESFSRMLGAKAFTRDASAEPRLRPRALFAHTPRADKDQLAGKIGRSRNAPSLDARMSPKLDQRLASSRRFGFRDPKTGANGWRHDPRQRAIVKIHFFGHGGGGAAALKAHGRYLQRDANLPPTATQDRNDDRDRMKSHADYLSRDTASPFYDQFKSKVDGAARMAVWAREDKRHFRIIIAAEKGAELRDLKPYVRDVMARADAALGAQFDWVAVDHWDTDNPHTHVVLRGRHARGRPLILPRDFVKHGLRNLARDAATERLGTRTRDDERLALIREARAHRPTRLDALLARQLSETNELRMKQVEPPDGDPNVRSALKRRVQELERLGLAVRTRGDVFRFHGDWRERLQKMELHLDVRKRLMLERAPSVQPPHLSKPRDR